MGIRSNVFVECIQGLNALAETENEGFVVPVKEMSGRDLRKKPLELQGLRGCNFAGFLLVFIL